MKQHQRTARTSTALALAATATLAATTASASGFFVTDRGVRALGRGGAFVAGADDPHSVWYNPAGLTQGGNSFLIDFSLVSVGVHYARQSLPPGATDIVRYSAVDGSSAPLPIPTIVVTHNFGVRRWMFGAGIFAPNAAIMSFPGPDAAATPFGRTPPQRYSVINLEGSLLAIAGLWAAWAPNEVFSIGLGVQALVGNFNSRLSLSACPATITCQPEDPDWDAEAQLRVGPIFAPSGNLGIRIQPSRYVVIGLSGQLPFTVNAPATLAVRLPSHPFYDGAMVQGDRATVGFTLAPIVRAGVEVRPTERDRIELAGVFEFWGVHDRISLDPVRDETQPQGIQITGTRGVGTYDVGAVAIERGFQHAFSVRLGYERTQPIGTSGWYVQPRAGIAYESSATSPAYTSVLTLDANKFVASIGASFGRGPLRLDVVYAHAFTSQVATDPRDARLNAVLPFRANSQAPRYAINGGVYDMAVNVFGLGLRYQF